VERTIFITIYESTDCQTLHTQFSNQSDIENFVHVMYISEKKCIGIYVFTERNVLFRQR